MNYVAQRNVIKIDQLQRNFNAVRDEAESLKAESHKLVASNEELTQQNNTLSEQVKALTKKIELIRTTLKADYSKLFLNKFLKAKQTNQLRPLNVKMEWRKWQLYWPL